MNASKIVAGLSETQSPPDIPQLEGNDSTRLSDENDPDLRRVRELLALHPTVKAQHAQAFNTGLESARQDIGALIRRLKGVEGSGGLSSMLAR